MDELFVRNRRSWPEKLRKAFLGWFLGAHGHNSFAVHIPAALAVGLVSGYFRISAVEWCILIGCVTAVLAAELFNSALETLAKAVSPYKNEYISQALDIASGAVLLTGVGAAAVGLTIFGPRILALIR